jgi:hypothetical protein
MYFLWSEQTFDCFHLFFLGLLRHYDGGPGRYIYIYPQKQWQVMRPTKTMVTTVNQRGSVKKMNKTNNCQYVGSFAMLGKGGGKVGLCHHQFEMTNNLMWDFAKIQFEREIKNSNIQNAAYEIRAKSELIIYGYSKGYIRSRETWWC